MNDPLNELQAAVSTMRAELDKVKAELSSLRKVVQVSEDEDGRPFRVLNCEILMVRKRGAKGEHAVSISSDESGGYVTLLYPENEGGGASAAMNLMFDESGVPQVVLRGQDGSMRVLLQAEEQRGTVAVLSEGGIPGAVMHGQPGGGSVAVLQADGQSRGVLIHSDDQGGGNTQLIFADENVQTQMKLVADHKHSILMMPQPEMPQALILASGKDGGSLMLNSGSGAAHVSLAATDQMACLTVKEGRIDEEDGAEVRISAGAAFGSAVSLTDELGNKRAVLDVIKDSSGLTFFSNDEKETISLMNHGVKGSTLKLYGAEEQECVILLVSGDTSGVTVRSPEDHKTSANMIITSGKPTLFIAESGQGKVMVNTVENCGIVSVYGTRGNEGGSASLCGGERGGTVRVGTSDGTNFASLDATDHGGRLLINNDLGIQRIALGVYQESASLHMNNTGNIGVSACATELGGVLCVHDSQGNIAATLSAKDGDS